MEKTWRLRLECLFLIMVLTGQSTTSSAAPSLIAARPGLQVHTEGQKSLTLEFRLPAFRVEMGQLEGEPCQYIRVPGYAETGSPGEPRLPVTGALIGVPASGEIEMAILDSETARLSLEHPLCPVDGTPPESQELAGNRLQPGQGPVNLNMAGSIRSQRVAQLQFLPFQLEPGGRAVRFYRQVRVRLQFSGGSEHVVRDSGQQDEGLFEAFLQQSLINYAQARHWRTYPAPEILAATPEAAQTQPAFKIQVDRDGLYRLSYSALQTAGVPVDSLNPRRLRLFSHDTEVALYVAGEQDQVFDNSDFVLFYGQKNETRFTNINVYWLTWGETDGLRMASRDGAPGAAATPTTFRHTQRAEENLSYQPSLSSGPDGDHWYWGNVYASGTPATKNFSISLKNLATGEYTATVRGLLKGYTATPQHHTRIYLNDHLLDDAFWASKAEHTFQVEIPQAYLLEGQNTFKVECPLDNQITQDIPFINWFEVDYARAYKAENDILAFTGQAPGGWKYQVSGFSNGTLDVYDISSPLAPVRILNSAVTSVGSTYTLSFQQESAQASRYLAQAQTRQLEPLSLQADSPSQLRSTSSGADYILIAPANLLEAAAPLANRRQAQGLRTQSVNVQDIYDEFNAGVFDPAAIQRFLAYAYANWQPPAPAYVVLVGDGNYDFKNYFGYGESNYIPPYLGDFDPWILETASDNRYVTVSGEDALPDLFIGRLPVKTAAETSALVTKLLDYETDPAPGNWNEKTLFVTDNADSSGNFAAAADAIIANSLPSAFTTQKVYYGSTHTSASAARTAILSAVNEGRFLVTYYGHAGTQLWAAESLLSTGDVASLSNGRRLPFVAAMTCQEGYFIFPSPSGKDYSSLAESMVRAAGKGAVASLSPTGFGLGSGHHYLNDSLFEAFFYKGITQIGPAVTYAKLQLASQSGLYNYMVDTYLLFGDPALRLQAANHSDLQLSMTVSPNGDLRPGQAISYQINYTNAGPGLATQVVIRDLLPAALINPTFTFSGPVLTARSGSRYVWDVADLPPDSGGTITISATVNPAFYGNFDNTASIETSSVERDTSNNSANIRSLVPQRVYLPFTKR